jgi:hypothetical protein
VTFGIPGPTHRQRRSRINAPILRLLVNKVPLSRIAELEHVSFPTLYDKITHIHRQCALFTAAREAKLPRMALGRMILATDRQDYLVNWGSRTSRKTIQLTAVATADRFSGYVFGLAPNFDSSTNQELVEAAWLASDDAIRPPHLRDWARVWTRADYEASLARNAGRGGENTRGDVEAVGTARADLEADEALIEGQQLPTRGVQVHADYLVHGHYHLLRRLLAPGADRITFCLDEDAGLLAACLSAFADRVRDGAAEVVQVRVEKNLTIDQRRRELAQARRQFEAAKGKLYPELNDLRAGVRMLESVVRDLRDASPLASSRLAGLWIPNPLPDEAEPRKFWRLISDTDRLSDLRAAWLLRRASLAPIDTVFNALRRRVAMFERPVQSVRRARRAWHIYAPYDPTVLVKLLEIFRVWHNYLWRSPSDNRTPAERLGLARGDVREDHILGWDMREAVERLWTRQGASKQEAGDYQAR